MRRERWLLVLAPFCYLLFESLFAISSQIGERSFVLALVLTAWMVSWWVFEVLPLGVTALIPLFYLPALGLAPLKEVTPAYSNPVIYLFLGGFVIARALEKTHLDERLALRILRLTGRSDRGIINGFVIATAGLSLWISNTATAVMMVPIAFSITHFLRENLPKDQIASLAPFQTVLFLSIAYAANIGGVMTPIGTPPNVVFAGYLSDLYGRNLDFWRWMAATIPLGISLLIAMVWLLRRLNPFALTVPAGFADFIGSKIREQGPLSAAQQITIFVFSLAAGSWICKDLINYGLGADVLNDTSIAIFAAVLLFLIPSHLSLWQPVLEQADIQKLPWDIVLLFGGGMAMAGSLEKVGLVEAATQFFADLDFSHPYLLIFVISALVLTLTEIMSNVALCVVALPVIMKLGEAQGIDPVLIALPATLCSSFAFTMPISTPPNAVVFGTNTISIAQMLRAGAILNFLSVCLTMSVGYFLIKWLLASS